MDRSAAWGNHSAYSPCALFLVLLLLIGGAHGCDNGECKISESCSQTSDCMPGLVCSNTCTTTPRCLRAQSFDVVALNSSLPFNKYSWLTTHNAFAIMNSASLTGSPIVAPENQEDSVTQQLNNGVRGFMLDMYDFMNDVWLCHSIFGQCLNVTAFQPAINTLKEMEAFLSANPSAIITIFIEDYVSSPNGLTRVFTNAGLMKYWFPVSKMPKDGSDWPTLSDMISNNQRLIVFTSRSAKERTEGIAYQWRYVAENNYGDDSLRQCLKRAESTALDNKGVSLIVENYFPTNPNENDTCTHNSRALSQMLTSCSTAAGQRWANFLAVDFYKRSTGGGSFQAVDILNGKQLCGCGDVHECEPDLARGVCNTTNTPQVADTDDVVPTSSSSPQPRSAAPGSASPPPVRVSYMIGVLSVLLGSWIILQ